MKLVGMGGGLLAVDRQETGLMEEGNKVTPKPDSQGLYLKYTALGISHLFHPLRTILPFNFFPL